MKVKPEQKDSINKLSQEKLPKPATMPAQAKPAASSFTPPTAMVTSPPPFGGYQNQQYSYPSDGVQLDIFNDQDFFYESIPSIDNYQIDGTQAIVDLEKQLEDAGYESGDFRVDVRLLRNYLGSATGLKLLVQEVSPDRLEVRLIPAQITNIANPNAQAINNAFAQYFSEGFFKLEKQLVLANLYLFLDPRTSILISDYVQDKYSVSVYPYGIIFKLQEPLPLAAQVGAFLWVAQETNPPVREKVIMYPKRAGSRYTKVKGPNFDVLRKKTLSTSTDYYSWDEILENNTQQLTRTVFSQSLVEGVELNVDYTQFNNFVKFSSAYERIKNFEYKVKLIESYQGVSSSLAASNATGSAYVQAQITSTQNKVNNIIGAFDGFEKYMYFESSSYVSNSFGQFLDVAWPKSTSTKPYTLYGSNTQQVEDWLTGILESASIYDNTNGHSLRKLVPEHLLQEESQIVDSFVSMLGHFFDIQYEYINQIPKVYDRQQKITEGFAKELVYHVANNLGLDFSNGDNFQDLWSYTLGLNTSGSYDNTLKLTGEDRTREIWKRIVNNLPYLLKTKGTSRGIRALINCYGIPSTILRIREYGGPETDFSKQSTYDHDRFYYALKTTPGTTNLVTPWSGSSVGADKPPVGVQIRFKANEASSLSCLFNWDNGALTRYGAVFVGRDGNGDFIEYQGNASESAAYLSQKLYVPVQNTTGSLFDGKWVNFYLRRSGSFTATTTTGSYTMFAGLKTAYSATPLIYSASWGWSGSSTDVAGTTGYKQYRADRWWYTGSKYVKTVAGFVPTLGAPTTQSLSGSIQEFRLWGQTPVVVSTPSVGSVLCETNGTNLRQSPFYAHTISPTSIVGQNYDNANHTGATSSYSDLIHRQTLGTNNVKTDFGGVGTYDLSGSQPNQNYTLLTTFNGFTTGTSSYWQPIVETNYMPWPDIAGNRQISNKVRIDNTVRTSNQLYRDKKVETSLQDNQPVDSPRLGIYLSPTDEINKDIAEQFGGLSMDDFIGSYNDIYGDSYPDLNGIKTEYLKKNQRKHGTQTYVRLLREFNGSLFSIIKQLVPYRANLQTGLVVESDMLHRNKVKTASRPQTQNEYYETNIDLPSAEDPTGEVRNYEGEVTPMPETEILGDNVAVHSGTVNGQNIVGVTAKENEYNNNQVEPLEDTIYRNVTSYGRDSIMGSQYNFFSWYLTGSTPYSGITTNSAGFAYLDSVGEDYSNPLALDATSGRASEIFTSEQEPYYDGTDFFNGSGSSGPIEASTILAYGNPGGWAAAVPYAYSYNQNYWSTPQANATSGGPITASLFKWYGVRFETPYSQSYTTYQTNSFYILNQSAITFYSSGGFSTATATVGAATVPLLHKSHPETLYTLKLRASSTTTSQIRVKFGTISSSYSITQSINTAATDYTFTSKADGPRLHIELLSWTDSATKNWNIGEVSSTTTINNLELYAHIPVAIQDYQVGPLASIGQRNQKYDGCKLVAGDFNEDSPDTIDGGPVVEIIVGPGANIAVNPTNSPNQITRDGFKPATPPTSTPRNTSLQR